MVKITKKLAIIALTISLSNTAFSQDLPVDIEIQEQFMTALSFCSSIYSHVTDGGTKKFSGVYELDIKNIEEAKDRQRNYLLKRMSENDVSQMFLKSLTNGASSYYVLLMGIKDLDETTKKTEIMERVKACRGIVMDINEGFDILGN